MQPGAKKKDLSAKLGDLVWPSQPSTLSCIVTNYAQLYWRLPCGLHLRYMTIQAANNQLKNPKHPNMLAKCERCSVGPYRTQPPEPQPHDKHRSYYEICTWLAVESALCMPSTMTYITNTSPAPYNLLVGADLGYVVEAKVVKHWKGGVDIFVPGLNLIIQVDGEQHDEEGQQDKDMQFMFLAVQQQFNVLRVHYSDVRHAHREVGCVVAACMQAKSRPIAKCSRHHVLLQHSRFPELS